MIKNEDITEISKVNDYQGENITDSDKENKMDNCQRKEININDIKAILNKRNEDKRFLVNFNINNINSLININTEDNFPNCNINFLNEEHKNEDDNKKKDNKLKMKIKNKSTNINKININNKYKKRIDFIDFNKKITKNTIIENNKNSLNIKYKEINFNPLNSESNSKYKDILTPRSIGNHLKISQSSNQFNSLGLIIKKNITPNKFIYKDKEKKNLSPKNNIHIRINKKKHINYFIKKKSNKNDITDFSIENDKIKNIPKSNDNKKDKNIILLKYSKDYKSNNNNNKDKDKEKDKDKVKDKGINLLELIKVKKSEKDLLAKKEKEAKEEIIKYEKNNLKKQENEDDNNKKIEKENINDKKDKKDVNIPYNKAIFNKIIEEVKGEKNYIQKVVHRQIINQRDSLRNSFSYQNVKKYDTNTYKEITTKKIKNPFNNLSSKEIQYNNNGYNSINKNNRNSELNEDNYTSYTNISIFSNNFNNNLKNEENKKSSIKIKKIPLNKLKNRMKIPISNYNLTQRTNNTPRIASQNNYSLIQEANPNLIKYSYREKSKKINLNNIIPNSNNSIYYQGNNNISINNEHSENYDEKENKNNILYNKVKLKNRAGLINNKIKINKINSFSNNRNNTNSNLNINNTIQNNNPSKKIINISSSKICYERNYNQNYLSPKYLTNTNSKKILNTSNSISIPNDYQNKIIQEKKIGLFKKKLAGLSIDNEYNIGYKNISFNKLNNKKIDKTIFKSYILNNNPNVNDSFKINGYNKLTSGNNESMSFESITIDNLNKYCSYLSLKKDLLNINNTEKPKQNNDIKLEQIITLLNLEDLLIIEDKLNIILKILKNGKKVSDELFDLWNYFFSSSLKPKFEQIYKYFLKETEAMKIFINYSLILIIICYDFSFNLNKNNNNIYFSLFETLRLVYINLLIVISSIKNKIKLDNKDHYNLRLIEMSNINKIIGKNLINFNNHSYNEEDITFNRELLNNNTNLLINNISLIIKNYKQNNIFNLFCTIKTNSLEEINIFFRKNILHEDFLGCSVLASSYLKEKENFTPVKIPYITKKNNKKYSLVLDLDETLIHFKVNHKQNDEGVLKLRPGVFTFLEKVKEFYEIILFTEASEAYTGLIMEAFNKKNYFDYKLFRQHTIIIGQDFVKDLQRIGRPLDRIIIIDNIAQNFRMQKANGINIKSFFGENQKDQALIDLIPILTNIAKDNIDTRNGLIKYRDEIITKITSNLFRRNDEKDN